MKRLILALLCAASLTWTSGCGNLSPRMQPKIDNQQGKINELENLANSLKAEIGKLQNQAEIQNSQLDRVQQGLANYQSNNQNSGVQILSGSGGLLIALFGMVFGTIIALAYRTEAKKQEKTANLLAERIVIQNDPELTNQVFQAALYSEIEENVLKLVKKHQLRLLSFGLNMKPANPSI